MTSPFRSVWESLHERLYFFPPFPTEVDPLVLFALLLVGGLVAGEVLYRAGGLSRIVGYVLAGALAGPLTGWLDRESLILAKPFADVALGLLLLETGRHLDLAWLRANPRLLLTSLAESGLAFAAIYAFARLAVGLSPGWSAAAAAITMASAPAVVLMGAQESRAQGQVTQRMLLLTALGCAASFVVFTVVLGVVHAERSGDWIDALAHPLWVAGGSCLIGALCARLALVVAARQHGGPAARMFVLVAVALLAVGIARMLAVPVFLSLFMMGVVLNVGDRDRRLAYASLPDGLWMLAIVLFVVTGAMLPLGDMTLETVLQGLGLILVRGAAKLLGVVLSGGRDLPVGKQVLVGVGIQPLSATAIFMAAEISAVYPEVSAAALLLPLLAAAMMEFVGPQLCRYALQRAGEAETQESGRQP